MKYTNARMVEMAEGLEPLLCRRDRIGYVAARNTRILRNETQEYEQYRSELFEKYGTAVLDEDGNPTTQMFIPYNTPEFEAYTREIDDWSSIEHEPNIMKLKYEEAVGELSGEELLSCDWMFED